jgi:glycosyltransferase involved in cell wall biosynthesis
MYGAEAVILNLSRTLNETGHSSVLGVFSNSSNPNVQLHETALAQGIDSHLIVCEGQIDRGVGARIRALVASTGADVVHAHGYKADIYVYLALRSAKKPMVSTCHTWYDTDWMVTLYGKIDRLLLRSYAEVVAVSEEVKQQLLRAGVEAKKVHLIKNGIDLRPFAGAAPSLRDELCQGQPGCVVVGLVGRLAREKGVDLFVQAAAEVLKELPETRFVLVGDGPERAALEAQIDRLQVREKVRLAGPRSDMPSVYATLDVMVSASRQEGLPMAILEGLASGRAVIATAVGDVPNVVRDGSTGVLLLPEDVPALVSAMKRLLVDAKLRERLGAAGRNVIAKEFSAERMTADYLRIYRSALATGAKA